MKTLIRSLAVGVFALFAVLALSAQPASAGVGGTVYHGPSFERGGAAVTFRDYGEHMYVYDTETDGLYAMAIVDRYDTYGLKYYSTGSSRHVNFSISEGVTVRIKACKGGWNNPYSCSGWKYFVA